MVDPLGLQPSIILLVIFLSFVGAILSEKFRISYTTVMIALGLVLSFLNFSGELSTLPLDRSIILGLVVPPLIFEAAMHTKYAVLRTVRKTVLSLAIFGVIISALLTGLLLNLALGLPLVVALTFGVMVAPTDPISIVDVLKRTKAPQRLTTILETEGYFNDATAVVLFPIAISLTFSPLESATLFGYTLGGGLVVGLIVSGVAELLYRMITEPLAETYFTIAVMFGSYFLAETLGVSGLVSVAVAGLYMGNRTMNVAMSRETRVTMTKFWEVTTFIVTSFAFLLLGLRSDAGLLAKYSPFIIGAFAVILLARFASVYPIVGLTNMLGEKIPSSWRRILAMGGLRGVISVALALSLPDSFPFRQAIIAMTFGVALLSLIVQGESLVFYLNRTRLSEPRRESRTRARPKVHGLRIELSGSRGRPSNGGPILR
jgi:Na+:H+ antiporter